LVGRVFGPALFPIVLGQQHSFDKLVEFIQVDITEYGTAHASYNVAKKVVEFEYQEEIPRSRLRAAYGDGFKGAPLRCQLSGEGTIPQDARMCDGEATQGLAQEDKRIGGARHV
jgi:hypothetical protein